MPTPSQIPLGSVRGDYRPSAVIGRLPEEFAACLRIDWTRYEDDGWGEAMGAAFRASNGRYFALEHHFHTRRDGVASTSLITLFQDSEEAATIDLALCDLGLTMQDVTWLRDDVRLVPHDLIRQDDYGNQFCVGTFRCHADALAEQGRLTAAVHKQDYWIRAHAEVYRAPAKNHGTQN
jgi:hypothetical protein